MKIPGRQPIKTKTSEPTLELVPSCKPPDGLGKTCGHHVQFPAVMNS